VLRLQPPTGAAAVTTDREAMSGVRPYALDAGAAMRLWDVSLELLAD
jgi:hypothetical protein